MRCFQHSTREAIGVCSNCGRGLCSDCTTVEQGKLSYHGPCQTEIARGRQLLEKSERAMQQRSVVYETSGTVYQQSFALTGFLGLGMAVLGGVLISAHETVFGAALLGIGTIFIIRGIGLARAGKKYRDLAAEERSETAKS